MQQSSNHDSQRRIETMRWQVCAVSRAFTTDEPSADKSQRWAEACAKAAQLGFNVISVPLGFVDGQVEACARSCVEHGLALMLEAPLGHSNAGDASAAPLADALRKLPGEARVAVLIRDLAHADRSTIEATFAEMRDARGDVQITVWTPGMTPEQLVQCRDLGVAAVYSSLPWWDFRAAWLFEEYERLRAVAPVIAPIVDINASQAPDLTDRRRRQAVAPLVGDGLLAPLFPEEGEASADAPRVAEDGLAHAGIAYAPQRLTGPLAELTAVFRGDGKDGQLLLINPDTEGPAALQRGVIERALPDGYVMADEAAETFELKPGQWAEVPVRIAEYIVEHGVTSNQLRRSISNALRAPRIAIEAVSPTVDDGEFPAKRILGERVDIRANIFMDGHEELAAEVIWRAANEDAWQHTPMRPRGNDVWVAQITPRRLGRYDFVIRAWHDRWASYCVQLRKKAEAGVDVSVDVEEGRGLLASWLARASVDRPDVAQVIQHTLNAVGAPMSAEASSPSKRGRSPTSDAPEPTPISIPPATLEHVNLLLSAELAEAIRVVDEPVFETRTPIAYSLNIERSEAQFASWYEIFPRSQSPVPGKHGTLRDVIRQLPRIRQMGFDVLYFPPIHPIGTRNRKGRNNSLVAEPGDPGSPYAIGSPDGGHDAVHPELGSLDDFQALVKAAREHGMELALDFAIQCSPDHPWLRAHPDWFNWRVDGTLKYAENPPKRYEDIVNPDFYSARASSSRQAALWRALRDIVMFWAQQGVRIFRVDNPHTKPLPFWEWMIREVRDRYPDTIFLSEAFTRPAMMYRLAKVGFSQSYTYFTWRNTRQELTDYMTELNSLPIRNFFRPNFFVNTPDINPWFLQTSGRPGFLIRAVLAGTLSGSWGVYNGFELCEAAAVPGKEEYLDSEKYELRHWDLDRPGNIVEEITRLNRIRRNHPALRSHLGIRFHDAHNDQILFYSRHSPEGDSVVLVAVSLDPHNPQTGRLELSRGRLGARGHGPLPLHDLFEDRRFALHGDLHVIELSPARPFVIWALTNKEGAAA